MGILDSKVAIVTGSGRGIGRGEAIALAKEGAAVTVLARTLSDVEAVAKVTEWYRVLFAPGQVIELRALDVQRGMDKLRAKLAESDTHGGR